MILDAWTVATATIGTAATLLIGLYAVACLGLIIEIARGLWRAVQLQRIHDRAYREHRIISLAERAGRRKREHK